MTNGDWSNGTRLDNYFTINALRRQVALLCENQEHGDSVKIIKEKSTALEELLLTLQGEKNTKKQVETMKKIKQNLGELFFQTFNLANQLNFDISSSIQQKTRERKQNSSFDRNH